MRSDTYITGLILSEYINNNQKLQSVINFLQHLCHSWKFFDKIPLNTFHALLWMFSSESKLYHFK
jgi:hypothetical protein